MARRACEGRGGRGFYGGLRWSERGSGRPATEKRHGKARQKITLNAGRDIPFNKLVLSQQNVRKTKAGVSIQDLAEDIARRGLLTSLNVRAEVDADGKETGTYRIPAGGRRYRALELLVKQKRLSNTVGVPCIVSKTETPEVEDSLAEKRSAPRSASAGPVSRDNDAARAGRQRRGDRARFFISVATSGSAFGWLPSRRVCLNSTPMTK